MHSASNFKQMVIKGKFHKGRLIGMARLENEINAQGP
jgi:hypothetical protein